MTREHPGPAKIEVTPKGIEAAKVILGGLNPGVFIDLLPDGNLCIDGDELIAVDLEAILSLLGHKPEAFSQSRCVSGVISPIVQRRH